MKVEIGKNTLGDGNKMETSLRHYERSTHDIGYTWRSSMSVGTIVPFLTELILPGTTLDIELDIDMLTLPTIGPLFGSMKVQIDVFETPLRLYIAELHMNKLGIGKAMEKVLLPQIAISGKNYDFSKPLDRQQIHPSSILAHLNMVGLGHSSTSSPNVTRLFNAIPYLIKADEYKCYYANKQEEVGYIIHSNLKDLETTIEEMQINGMVNAGFSIPQTAGGLLLARFTPRTAITIQFNDPYEEFDVSRLTLTWDTAEGSVTGAITTWFKDATWNPVTKQLILSNPVYPNLIINFLNYNFNVKFNPEEQVEPELHEFPLENIDDMRTLILQNTPGVPFTLTKASIEPYGLALQTKEQDGDIIYTSAQCSQEGLYVKTYQSDRFNNWMNTEWITGNNGVDEVSKIEVVDGGIYINELITKKKVFDMLNRINLTGGSFDDWQQATYDHELKTQTESPMYIGGLSQELVFQSVISNAQTEQQPLGTLGGRGILTNNKKGGRIIAKADTPTYITANISITPRIDYSQGNKWDTNLRTMNDFHKPALDEIGFQDLVTDEMATWETAILPTNLPVYKSAGKQPSWIQYQTNVNVVRGNFAIETDSMFMVLNRRYEVGATVGGQPTIKDLTTYIDPKKYNFIFAGTRRDAQNYWAQINVKMERRAKMSANQIPNL